MIRNVSDALSTVPQLIGTPLEHEPGTAFEYANGNYVPDCDLANFGANGECGPMSNPNFGSTQAGVSYGETFTIGTPQAGEIEQEHSRES